MSHRFATFLAASLLTLIASPGVIPAEPAAATPSPSQSEPAYTSDGKLKLPANYREWVFLSSGLDMSYSEKPDMQDHSMFDNVFVDPQSYREFLKTGTWRDKTQLVMENRGASEKGSINQHGKFQTDDLMGVEVHVKDTARFQGGWGFFAFQSVDPAGQIPTTAACYSCHQQHAAVDTTFVQFYPTLLKIAKEKKTLSPNYRP
jgi:hypothetical protein